MNTSFSVVVCTYNPVSSIFSKCLESIVQAARINPPTEIIIVDNNSNNNFFNEDYFIEFMHQPNTSLVKEEKQGLTPARLKGIDVSSGEIIIFIDDDNFIAPNFFLEGINIASQYPFIGAWSGQVELIFEEKPEDWTKKYWGLLVHREFSTNRWSNLPHNDYTMPCGAGLFIRRSVGNAYKSLHTEGKRLIQLDRSASSLLSGGDNDLAACACDIGMGVGLFNNISLKHYIPRNRLSIEYLLKLTTGITASALIFRSFRGETPTPKTWKNKLANVLRLALMKPIERKFFIAFLKGEEIGVNLLKSKK